MKEQIFYREKEKSAGIELFRIVSMLMILVLHINMCGGLMGCFPKVNEKYITLWFGESSCYSCVDCFALISGYVMVGKKLKPKKIINIWLQVFSISAITATIFWIIFNNIQSTPELAITDPTFFNKVASNIRGIELQKITDGYLPLLKSQYWYFTAYFGMLFFVPIMNAGVEKLEKSTLKKCLIIILFLFCVVSTFDRKDLFRHSNGMGTFWLSVMYMVGAYFGKHGIDTKKYSKAKSAVYAILCAIVITSWIVIHSYNVGIETGTVTGQFDWLYYTNPVVVAQSIFMLLFFAQVKINNNIAKKIIFLLGASSFSVYLIHVQPLIFDLVFRGAFRWLSDFNFFVMAILVILCAMAIYLVCVILDNIRLFLFKILKINIFAEWVGNAINDFVDNLIKIL